MSQSEPFVRVEGTRMLRNGAPYHFLGFNFWYGINLASKGEGGDRDRLRRELDRLRALGVNNLRIMGASEGPDGEPWRMAPALQPAPGQFNEELLDGLDFLLAEMGKRDMVAVVCLNNFWAWSGGMAQYVAWAEEEAIPYPDPDDGSTYLPYMLFTSRFYRSKPARQLFREVLARLIERRNAYTGLAYRDDPTIMAWQLANEPRGMLRTKAYRRWIKKTAAYIRQLDPNHLISIGSEGNTASPTGNNFRKDHRLDDIDYTTIHIWAQNWGWYDPEDPSSLEAARAKAQDYFEKHLAWASDLDKPMVVEEFGISRDGNDHEPAAPDRLRQQYFRFLFELFYDAAREGGVAGANIWAWGGEGRPREAATFWRPGDDWIGDPPHERQGWYSVYDRDEAMLELIEDYAEKMDSLGKVD